MKKLWKIEWDTGYGCLNGLFLATDQEIESLIGTVLHFYEENGKHSEIEWIVEDGEIELFSDDEHVISHVKPFGYDPFEFLSGEE